MRRRAAETLSATAVRREWSARSTSDGWSFPSDWHTRAVEALCDAVADGTDPWAAAERLGRERAGAGISLGETLADVDVLAHLAAPEMAESLRRAVSLGWADRITAPPAGVVDPLTGLLSPDYLHARLGEVYRAAEVAGDRVPSSSALVVVRVDVSGECELDRALPMMVIAEAMRTVFSGGQTLSLLSERTAVVLCGRDRRLARRATLLHELLVPRLASDPQIAHADVQVWIESLPTLLPLAIDLLTDLGR